MTNHKSSFPKVKTEKKPKTYSTMEPINQDHPTTDSGSVAAPKRVCPKCGSGKVIMFTSDDDLCQTCGATFLGVLNGSSELASLRQQLKEREEALKELLPIAETELGLGRIKNPFNYDETKAIIERARKLLSK